MPSETAISWIRHHRRGVAIILAIALAFTIVAALVTPGFGTATDADSPSPIQIGADDGTMTVAGLSWSRSVRVAPPGAGTLGLSWS